MAPIIIDAAREESRYEIVTHKNPTPSEIATALEQASKALNKLALYMLESGDYTAANPLLGSVFQSAALTEQVSTAMRQGSPLMGAGLGPRRMN